MQNTGKSRLKIAMYFQIALNIIPAPPAQQIQSNKFKSSAATNAGERNIKRCCGNHLLSFVFCTGVRWSCVRQMQNLNLEAIHMRPYGPSWRKFIECLPVAWLRLL
jgi:hypothetical protein